LFVAKQTIKNREATAKDYAERLEISEALLISAMARVRWVDPALRKASRGIQLGGAYVGPDGRGRARKLQLCLHEF
jgi:hypothetical protein